MLYEPFLAQLFRILLGRIMHTLIKLSLEHLFYLPG
jgi:hypothetical protein